MKLTSDKVNRAVARLGLMAFFPADPDIRAALVWELMEIADTDEHLDWLIRRALRLYGKWPGVSELRALYSTKWKPKDGFTAGSTVYPDGIPSERPQNEFRDARRDEPVTADPELNRQIHEVAEQKKLKFGRRDYDPTDMASR